MPIVIDPAAYYSEQEYADIVRKKLSTVRKDKCRGTGPAFSKLGSELFFRGSDILAHLEKSRARHGAEWMQPGVVPPWACSRSAMAGSPPWRKLLLRKHVCGRPRPLLRDALKSAPASPGPPGNAAQPRSCSAAWAGHPSEGPVPTYRASPVSLFVSGGPRAADQAILDGPAVRAGSSKIEHQRGRSPEPEKRSEKPEGSPQKAN